MATAVSYCGVGLNYNDGGNNPWGFPENIQGNQSLLYSSVSISTNGGTSQKLRATTFGFNIPTNATINGVLAEIEMYSATNNYFFENNVQLLKTGAESGTNKSTGAVIFTKSYHSFGGSADLWGNTLTPSDVNNYGFGVSFKINRNNPSGFANCRVYRVNITVTYTVPVTQKYFTDALAATSSTSTFGLIGRRSCTDTLSLTSLTSTYGFIVGRSFADALSLTSSTSGAKLFRFTSVSDTSNITSLTSASKFIILKSTSDTLAITSLSGSLTLIRANGFSKSITISSSTNQAKLFRIFSLYDTLNISSQTLTVTVFASTGFTGYVVVSSLTKSLYISQFFTIYQLVGNAWIENNNYSLYRFDGSIWNEVEGGIIII